MLCRVHASAQKEFRLRPKDAKPDEYTMADVVDDGVSQIVNAPDGEVKVWDAGNVNGKGTHRIITKNGNVLSINDPEIGNFSLRLTVDESKNQVVLDRFEGKIKGAPARPKSVTIWSNSEGVVHTKAKLPWLLKPFQGLTKNKWE